MEVFSHLPEPSFICTHFCYSHTPFSWISLFIVSHMTTHPILAATLHGQYLLSVTATLTSSHHHSLPFLTPPPTLLIAHTFLYLIMALLNTCHSSSTPLYSLSLTTFYSSVILSWCSIMFSYLFKLTHFQNFLCLSNSFNLHPPHTYISSAFPPQGSGRTYLPLLYFYYVPRYNHVIHHCSTHNPSIVLYHPSILVNIFLLEQSVSNH